MIVERKNNAMLFATYTMLYANDMACNCIKDIKDFAKEKDKETQKIYGALYKRVREYDHQMEHLLGHDMFFIAYYNEHVDEIAYERLKNLRLSLQAMFESNGIDDSEYFSYIETAYIICGWSVVSIDLLYKGLNNVDIRGTNIKSYELKDILRVMTNLRKWAYRHMTLDVEANYNSDIRKFTDSLTTSVFNSKLFEEAYNYAIKTNKEEENKQK